MAPKTRAVGAADFPRGCLITIPRNHHRCSYQFRGRLHMVPRYFRDYFSLHRTIISTWIDSQAIFSTWIASEARQGARGLPCSNSWGISKKVKDVRKVWNVRWENRGPTSVVGRPDPANPKSVHLIVVDTLNDNPWTPTWSLESSTRTRNMSLTCICLLLRPCPWTRELW